MIREILEEHVDEAEHLFGRLLLSTRMLDLTEGDVAQLRARLAAHLDGLLLDPEASWELLAASIAPEAPPERAALAAALALAARPHGLVAELEEALIAHPAAEALWSGVAAGALHAPGEEATPRLGAWLQRFEPGFRAVALRGLAARGALPPERIGASFAADDAAERVAALEAAADTDTSFEPAALQPLLADAHPEVRAAALRAAARHAPPLAAASARRFLAGDAAVAPAAATALGRLGGPEDLELLTAAAAAADPELRRACLLAMGELGDARALPALTAALEQARFAGVATQALQRLLGERCPLEPAPPPSDDPEAELAGDWHPDDDLPRFDAIQMRIWFEQSPSTILPSSAQPSGAPAR